MSIVVLLKNLFSYSLKYLCDTIYFNKKKLFFHFFIQNELVCCGVLSGNRNFEGRIHPNTRANYLASPLLVIAYAIAGRMDIDFETEPIGER